MNEFFEKAYYGNTIAEWLVALLILFGSLIIAKLVYWFLGNVVKKLASKTKTMLDDIIVDMVEEPVVFGIVILGMWYATEAMTMSEGFVDFRSKVLYILIVFDVAWLFVRTIDALIVEYLEPLVKATEGNLDNQMLPIVRKGIKVIVWVLATVVGLNNAGYDVGAIIAGLGIGGLALAMAAKDTVANLFGGITIFTDKPFKINDRIKINGFDGYVKTIGVRSTRLVTWEGRRVTIPNSSFSATPIENVSSEPSRMVFKTVKFPYDLSKEQLLTAKGILKKATVKDEIINSYINLVGFDDFCLNVTMMYYIKPGSDNYGVQDIVNTEVFVKLKEANIDLAVPKHNIVNTEV